MVYTQRKICSDYVIFLSALFCATLLPLSACKAQGLPNIGGGPLGPTSPVTEDLSTQIVLGQFADKPHLMFTSWKTSADGSMKTLWMPNGSGQSSLPRTQKNKTLIPPAAVSVFQQTTGSFLRTRVHINHPAGAVLFPHDGNLATLFDTFLQSCRSADGDPAAKGYNFLLYFSQLHLNILHELYEYLIGIYTTMNLTHYGIYSQAYMSYLEQFRKQPDPAQITTWQISPLEDYLAKEDIYGLNKKILIINHLINIIEAQSNKAILARFPSMPAHLATRAGMTMIKYDYGAKLDLLIDKQEIAFINAIAPDLASAQKQAAGNVIASMRTNYIKAFASYLALFKEYTALLGQGSTGVDTFVNHAQTIENVLSKASPQFNPQTTTKGLATEIRNMETINPPVFFYNNEAMRGIKLIPMIAQTLPQKLTNVPLPQKIIDEATKGTMLPFGNSKVAFYAEDERGVKQLYINIPTAQGMFSQKLLPQPDWLNTPKGAISMLRACLGDFTMLLEGDLAQENILDPCLVCILSSAVHSGGTAPSACTDCSTYLNTIRNFIAQAQASNGLPTLGSGNLPAPSGGLP